MRIIAIGVGGAGCRIVDNLYAMDRKSSKVVCVHGLAVDVDEETIKTAHRASRKCTYVLFRP